jgi:ribosomal protein L15E
MRNASVAEKKEIIVKSRVNEGEINGIYPSLSGCWDKPTSIGVIGCALESAWEWITA